LKLDGPLNGKEQEDELTYNHRSHESGHISASKIDIDDDKHLMGTYPNR